MSGTGSPPCQSFGTDNPLVGRIDGWSHKRREAPDRTPPIDRLTIAPSVAGWVSRLRGHRTERAARLKSAFEADTNRIDRRLHSELEINPLQSQIEFGPRNEQVMRSQCATSSIDQRLQNQPFLIAQELESADRIIGHAAPPPKVSPPRFPLPRPVSSAPAPSSTPITPSPVQLLIRHC